MSWIKTVEGRYFHTDLIACVMSRKDSGTYICFADDGNFLTTSMSADEVMDLIKEAEEAERNQNV